MRRQTLPFIVVSVLVIASALFMGWTALRTVQPAATPFPTPSLVAPTSTAAPTAKHALPGGGEIDLGLLTMALPEDWRFLRNEWPETAPAGLDNSPPMLAAWQGSEQFGEAPLRFTLLSVKRNALSLQRYANDVRQELDANEEVSDIETSIDTTFRADALPVAYIHYTQETPAGSIRGYQAATFDAAGDQIVIATLVQQAGGDDVEQILRSLVRSMNFVARQ